MANKGLRRAVDDFCKQCIVDARPGNGTWRQQIEDCTARNCPLYPHRPVTISLKKQRLLNSKQRFLETDTKVPGQEIDVE